MNHPMTGRRNLCLCKLYGLPQKCVCGDCSPLSLCEQAPIGRHSETERMQTTPTTTAWPMRRTKAGGTAYKQKYEHKKHQEQTLMANALTCRLAWQCDRAVPQTATTQPLPTSFPDNLQPRRGKFALLEIEGEDSGHDHPQPRNLSVQWLPAQVVN